MSFGPVPDPDNCFMINKSHVEITMATNIFVKGVPDFSFNFVYVEIEFTPKAELKEEAGLPSHEASHGETTSTY